MKNKTIIIVAGLIFSLLLPIHVTFAEGGGSIQASTTSEATPAPAVKNTTTINSFSLDPMCQKTYGENSFYAGESAGNTASGCACKNGYSWNNKANRTACVIQSNDEICADTLGNNWKWDGTRNEKGSLNCGCKEGFAQNNGDCVIPPTEEKAVIPIVEQALVSKKETVTPKAPIPRIESKSFTPSFKKEVKKPNIVKIEPKKEVIPQANPEPIKKIKWYQKIFSWFW